MSADRLSIEVARRMQVVDRMDESLQAVRRSCQSICQLTSPITISRFAFRPLLDSVLEGVAATLQHNNINVDVDVPSSALVAGDRELIEVACRTLLQIAARSMPGGGEVSVSAVASGAHWEIEFADSSSRQVCRDGSNTFPMAVSAQLDPMDAIGVEVVEHIARRHGGSISATNCPQGGVAWTLAFPAIANRMAA